MNSNPLIIINNRAARAAEAWPIIRQKLEESNIQFVVHVTTRAGNATIAVRNALEHGCNTIAVVGGDGTLGEAAEGFFELAATPQSGLPQQISPEATLAILPAGTGDDFARGLIGRRMPLEQWVSTLLAHLQGHTTNTRSVDVLYGISDNYTRPFICLNASTMGIGGETANRVAAQGNVMRRFSGETRFMAAALGALVAWRERPVRVSVDDQTVVDSSMNLAAVANNRYAGGGMMLSPAARIDDGQLDVVTASGFSRAGIIRELRRIHTGGHVANPRVQIHQGKKARIETFAPEDAMLIEADGNLRGKTPVEFRLMPGALRFVVGPAH